MVTDPADLADDEVEGYLKELFDSTEELNATAIQIVVRDDIVYLNGDVPTVQQSDLAEMLVLDVVPEDSLVNDLMIIPEAGVWPFATSPQPTSQLDTPPEATLLNYSHSA